MFAFVDTSVSRNANTAQNYRENPLIKTCIRVILVGEQEVITEQSGTMQVAGRNDSTTKETAPEEAAQEPRTDIVAVAQQGPADGDAISEESTPEDDIQEPMVSSEGLTALNRLISEVALTNKLITVRLPEEWERDAWKERTSEIALTNKLIIELLPEERERNAWKERANAVAEGHSSTAIVSSLVFGYAVTSFLRMSGSWYDDTVAKGGGREGAAVCYVIVMAVVCVFGAMSLMLSAMQCWILKVAGAYRCTAEGQREPLDLMFCSGFWIDICGFAFAWYAVELALVGLALYTVAMLGVDFRTSTCAISFFAIGIFLSIIFQVVVVNFNFRNMISKSDIAFGHPTRTGS